MSKDLVWAEELVSKVLTYEGRIHAPRFKFYFSSRNKVSNGITFRKPYKGYSIFIRVGSDIEDAKGVLLHEMAHWIVGSKRRHGHDKKFWKKAWELFFLFAEEINLEKFKEREFNYKQKAKQVYDEYIMSGFQPHGISFVNSKPVKLVKESRKKEIKRQVNVRDVRYQQALKMVKKYQTKVKRDKTLLAKWENKVKYYQKSLK